MQMLRFSFLLGILSLTACPGIGQILRGYGYTEVRPPSNLMAPGSMVWIHSVEPFTAGVICTQNASLGAAFQPMVSGTVSSQLTKDSTNAFSLDAAYMDIVKADAKFSHISGITARLSHATLFEVNDVDVLSNVMRRDPACSAAVKMRIEGGYPITMISSALQADVTYEVQWDVSAQLDIAAKIAVVQNLAIALGLQGSHVSDQLIEAKGLYWGIKDDAYLAHISEPNTMPPAIPGSRIIAVERTPRLNPTPDVQ